MNKTSKKVVGLLGGMTYDATSLYYNIINARVRQRLGGRHSAPLIIYSFDFDPLLHDMSTGKWDHVANQFISVAQHMKAAGAEGLAICANYPHKVADTLEEQTGMTFLHIADMTAQAIQKSGKRKVGLIGTINVMEEDYIKGRISRKFGIDVLVPEDQGLRNEIHEALMVTLPSGIVTDELQELLASTAKALVDEGSEGIILGSTDLAFALKPEHVNVPLFDTNKIHAEGIADWLIGNEARG